MAANRQKENKDIIEPGSREKGARHKKTNFHLLGHEGKQMIHNFSAMLLYQVRLAVSVTGCMTNGWTTAADSGF